MRLNSIDLRHLRYFVAVAEELHFARAAKRLNMSQPPLSQQIMALEDYLGFKLFERTKRVVSLTPAGRVFYEEVRGFLLNFSRIAERSRHAMKGLRGHLRIGVNFSAPLHPFTSDLLRSFHQACPQIQIELLLHEKSNVLQLADIKSADLDAALIWLDKSYHSRDIFRVDLASDVMEAVVPENHPLARQKNIHIRDLVDQPFIGQPRHSGTRRYECIMECFGAIDAEPTVTSEILQMPLVASMVAAGQGVSILPAFLKHMPTKGLIYKPLILPRRKTPCMVYSLVTSTRSENPALSLFVSTAEKLAKMRSQ